MALLGKGKKLERCQGRIIQTLMAFGKLARWKNRQLSLIGKSVIVSSQLLPIIMFTGSVMSIPASMNQELSRGNLQIYLEW
jgi:hypothetical protein